MIINLIKIRFIYVILIILGTPIYVSAANQKQDSSDSAVGFYGEMPEEAGEIEAAGEQPGEWTRLSLPQTGQTGGYAVQLIGAGALGGGYYLLKKRGNRQHQM